MKLDKKKYLSYLLNKESRFNLCMKWMKKYIEDTREGKATGYIYPPGFNSMYARSVNKNTIIFKSDLSYEEGLKEAIERYNEKKKENPKITEFTIHNRQLNYTSVGNVDQEVERFINKQNQSGGDKLQSMAVLLTLEFLEDMGIEDKELKRIMNVVTSFYEIKYKLIGIYYNRVFSDDIEEENILKVIKDMVDNTSISDPYVYNIFVNISEERKKIANDYN